MIKWSRKATRRKAVFSAIFFNREREIDLKAHDFDRANVYIRSRSQFSSAKEKKLKTFKKNRYQM